MLSIRDGVRLISTSPSSVGKLRKFASFNLFVSSVSANLADISVMQPPQVR